MSGAVVSATWRELPPLARALHTALILLAAAAVASTALVWPGPPVSGASPNLALELGLVLGLIVSSAVSAWYGDVLATRATQHQVPIMIAAAFHLAAALLLPLVEALAVVAATTASLHVRWRPAFFAQVCSASANVLSVVLAAVVYRAASVGVHGTPRLLLAACVAALVYALVDMGVLSAHLWFAWGIRPFRTVYLSPLEKLSQLTFGVLFAALWATSPALVALLVPLGITLQRSVAFRSVELASRTDPKTGLLNDRAFRAAGALELRRAARTSESLALLMLDLDHLREVNNTHGHLAGDAVIRRLAEVLGAELREHDVAGRFGGEEFAVLLPSTRLPEAYAVAERVRSAFGGVAIPIGEGEIVATVSIGVAPMDATTELDDLIRAADTALYAAKHAGRNTVRGTEPGPAAVVLPHQRPPTEQERTLPA